MISDSDDRCLGADGESALADSAAIYPAGEGLVAASAKASASVARSAPSTHYFPPTRFSCLLNRFCGEDLAIANIQSKELIPRSLLELRKSGQGKNLLALSAGA
jgi:hypothetical protein